MGDLFETAREKHWKLQWRILELQCKRFETAIQEIWNCDARDLKLQCKRFKTAMQGFLGCHKKNKARMLHSLRAS